ncbi:RpiB/LacA/LacB family sugar-phosphate isomerase [Candidatus Nomurabacteria bacterium]|nr:RpiB/LacA/LacB family sugar-phosphate isomerase [Candidatus Kaiserbacteria bacterium]MCB9810017.1 RpiB/LacA/LacB family sugar-phosphate isomerase [Candidatus Nomurabacteria bacterium]
MNIHLATDHAGFHHKEAVASWLKENGFTVVDHGATEYDEVDDFTDFISKAAEAVSKKPSDRAVIFGGSGQGEGILANRYPAVRTVVYYGGDESIPALSRQHNDSNVISIGARFVDIDLTKKVIWDWLHTDVLKDEKYHRRNKKIETITKQVRT